MNPSRIAAIVLRQFYLLRGSPSRIVPLFAWVAVDVILWGFISRYIGSISASGGNFIPRFLGAVLLWDFLTRVMQGVTMAFFEDVWARNFLNIFASPLKISEYVTGLVLSSIATSSIGLLAMFVLASTVFGFSFLAYGVLIIPFLLVLFLFGIALGITGCGIVLRFGPASEWFIWPIPMFLAPFACVFYPLATLPPWMQLVAQVIPPAHVFESLRAVLSGGSASPARLALSAFLAVLDVGLAGWFFSRVFRKAVKTGLIARYSAESVS